MSRGGVSYKNDVKTLTRDSAPHTEAILFPTEIAYGVHDKDWGRRAQVAISPVNLGPITCENVAGMLTGFYRNLFPGPDYPDTSLVPVGSRG